VTTWSAWKRAHPKTTVLGPVLPQKSYDDTTKGYARYEKGGRPYFPTGPKKTSKRFRAMDRITIVRYDGKARAYPHRLLKEGKNPDGKWTATRTRGAVVVRDAQGKIVPSMTAYWFAFGAFYPDGTVWDPKPIKDPK